MEIDQCSNFTFFNYHILCPHMDGVGGGGRITIPQGFHPMTVFLKNSQSDPKLSTFSKFPEFLLQMLVNFESE